MTVVGQTVSEALTLPVVTCPDREVRSSLVDALVSEFTSADVPGRRPTASPVAGDLPITPTWAGLGAVMSQKAKFSGSSRAVPWVALSFVEGVSAR